ncbi:Protein SMG9 [Amphibalanus amphitrite]|uniref:Protein SMG9 n=1 Tax=Amphibalanus amphitrite TaxID=1232801 RepID=A0A6A4VIK2_AMPAM|nr:Protein SMG9 [Amphibalanus amphitrite]
MAVIYIISVFVTLVLPSEVVQWVLDTVGKTRNLLLKPQLQLPALQPELGLFRETVGRDLDTLGDLGLFRLQRSTVLSIIATILTYVIVMLQFHISEAGSLLQTAEMLKPSSTSAPSGDDSSTDHYPRLVFVHNRSTLAHFQPDNIRQLQEAAKQMGINVKKLTPPSGSLFAADGRELSCLGACQVALQLGSIKRTIAVSVVKKLHSSLLSWHDAVRLGILHKEFPQQIRSAISDEEETSRPAPAVCSLKTMPGKSKIPRRVVKRGSAPALEDAGKAQKVHPLKPTWDASKGVPSAEERRKHFSAMKEAFPRVFDVTSKLRKMSGGSMAIELTEDATPVSVSTARSVPFCWRDDIRRQLDELLESDVIEPEFYRSAFSHYLWVFQDFYRSAFSQSNLCVTSDIGVGSGGVLPQAGPETTGPPVNLLLLPEFLPGEDGVVTDDEAGQQEPLQCDLTGHWGLQTLVEALRSEVFRLPQLPLSNQPLSEKHWYHYAVRMWDSVRKSSFFHEYSRL